MIIKIAAHLCFGAGVTIWIDLFRGCTFNADQVAGLTICFAIAGLIVHQIVNTLAERRAHRKPEIDIRTLFEEV